MRPTPPSLMWLCKALFTYTIRGGKATVETGWELSFPLFHMNIYNIAALSHRLWRSRCWTYNNESFLRCLSKIKLYYLQYSSTGQVSWSNLSHGKWYSSPWCSSRSVALWEQITHNVRGPPPKLSLQHVDYTLLQMNYILCMSFYHTYMHYMFIITCRNENSWIVSSQKLYSDFFFSWLQQQCAHVQTASLCRSHWQVDVLYI